MPGYTLAQVNFQHLHFPGLAPLLTHTLTRPCTDASAAEGLQGLQARINELRDAEGPSTAGAAAGASTSSSWSSSSSLNQQIPGSRSAADDADSLDATASFSDAEDSEVSAALSRRIKQIATTTGEWGSSMDEEEMRQPLTGEVRLL